MSNGPSQINTGVNPQMSSRSSSTSTSNSPSPAAARLSGGISGPPGSVLSSQQKSSMRPSSADFITMLNPSNAGNAPSALSPGSQGPGTLAGVASASVIGQNKIINGPRPSSEILTGATGANHGVHNRLAPAINTTYAQEVEAIDRWFGEVEHTLEDMASTKVDDNFKEELSAIEQWFKVLSDVERTMALYSLFHHISHVQIRFFTTVLTQMARRDPTFGFLTPGSEKGESRPSSIVGEGAQDDQQSEFAQKLLSLIPQRLAANASARALGQTRGRLFDRTSMSSIDRSSISSIGDLQDESELLNHPATRGQKRASGGGHPLQEGSIPSPGSAPYLQKRTSGGGLPTFQDGSSPGATLSTGNSMENLNAAQRVGASALQYDSLSVRQGRAMAHRQGGHMFTASPGQSSLGTSSISPGSRSQPTSPIPSHGLAQALQGVSSLLAPAGINGSPNPGEYPRSPRSPRSPKPRSMGNGSNNGTPTGLHATGMNGNRGARSPQGGSSPFPQPEHGTNFGYGKDKGKIPEQITTQLLEDIPAWLRTLRLHKYTSIFENMRWQDMIQYDGEQLENLGVSALGARTKFLKVFDQVKQQMENGELKPVASPLPGQ